MFKENIRNESRKNTKKKLKNMFNVLSEKIGVAPETQTVKFEDVKENIRNESRKNTKKKLKNMFNVLKLKKKPEVVVKTVKNVKPSVLIMQRPQMEDEIRVPQSGEVIQVEKIADKTRRKPSLYRIKKKRKKILKSDGGNELNQAENWNGVIELKLDEDLSTTSMSSSINATAVASAEDEENNRNVEIKNEKLIKLDRMRRKMTTTTTLKPQTMKTHPGIRLKPSKRPRKIFITTSTASPTSTEGEEVGNFGEKDPEYLKILRDFVKSEGEEDFKRHSAILDVVSEHKVQDLPTPLALSSDSEVLPEKSNQQPILEALPTPLAFKVEGRNKLRRQRLRKKRPKKKRNRRPHVEAVPFRKKEKNTPHRLEIHDPIIIKPKTKIVKGVEPAKIRLFYRKRQKPRRKTTQRPRRPHHDYHDFEEEDQYDYNYDEEPYLLDHDLERNPVTFSPLEPFTESGVVFSTPQIFTTPEQPHILSNFHSPFLSPTLDFKVTTTATTTSPVTQTTTRNYRRSTFDLHKTIMKPVEKYLEKADRLRDIPKNFEFEYQIKQPEVPPVDDKWHPIIAVNKPPETLADISRVGDDIGILIPDIEDLLVEDPYASRVSKALSQEILKVGDKKVTPTTTKMTMKPGRMLVPKKPKEEVDEDTYLNSPGPPYSIPSPHQVKSPPDKGFPGFPSSKDIPGHSDMFEENLIDRSNPKPLPPPEDYIRFTASTKKPSSKPTIIPYFDIKLLKTPRPEVIRSKVTTPPFSKTTRMPKPYTHDGSISRNDPSKLKSDEEQQPLFTFSSSPMFDNFKVKIVNEKEKRPYLVQSQPEGEIRETEDINKGSNLSPVLDNGLLEMQLEEVKPIVLPEFTHSLEKPINHKKIIKTPQLWKRRVPIDTTTTARIPILTKSKEGQTISRSMGFESPSMRDDAVDFGAATGEFGSFGWYSDHPLLNLEPFAQF